MDYYQFKAKTGHPPVYDDLTRVNCAKVGEFGHWQCGWCDIHDRPRFQCGSECLVRLHS